MLLSIDATAHGAGAGARRPLPALEGCWRDAAEQTLLAAQKEPANDVGGGALGPAGAHAAGADHSNACSAEKPATYGSTSTHDADVAHRADHRKTAAFAPLPLPALHQTPPPAGSAAQHQVL